MKLLIIRLIISTVILYTCGYGLVTLRNVWIKELDVKKMLPNPFGWIRFVKTTPELTQFAFSSFFTFEDHKSEKEFDSTPEALQKELHQPHRSRRAVAEGARRIQILPCVCGNACPNQSSQ